MYHKIVSNAKWEPRHVSIMTLDIEGFGSPTRNDPIRAGLRVALDAIVEGSLQDLGTAQPLVASGDTGDGKWLLLEASLPKTKLLAAIVPALEAELRHYNASASGAAAMRLRIGIHHGELISEKEEGYSGEALNHAFRIIDNDVIRQALKANQQNSITVISNDFFEKVVKPGYGRIDPDQFSPVQVNSKETSTIVWIKDSPPVRTPAGTFGTATANTHTILAANRTDQRVLTISDLPPTSLYVAITDIHNQRLYRRGFPEAPIQQHVEAALLLGDKVVIHCADPYRSSEVANLLIELSPCIESGDFLFLLGENFQDPGTHFRGYIDYKVDQYGKSEFGKRDVASLTEVDDDAADRAEHLLRLSPFALIRGFSGTDGFIRIAKEDMQPREAITIQEHFAVSMIGNLSLTIRQLLDLTQLGPAGLLERVVADNKTVGQLQVEVSRLVGHNSFSRQILISAIRRRTGLSADDPLDPIFEERVSQIHLIGTLGPLAHMEVTNRRDRLSPYYFGHLMDHLSHLAEVPHPNTFGPALVLELRALPSWAIFSAYHLRLSGAATHRVSLGEPNADLSSSYRWSRRLPEFESIRSIVRHHWG